jgi:hypothetical protein
LGLYRFAEKEFESVCAKFSLYELAVGDPADSRDIESGSGGDVFQDHGTKHCFVTCQKKLLLIL